MTTILSNRRSKFGMTCVQCSNELIAPEWSEYRNERQIHHVWRCWKCDYRFEFGHLVSCRQHVDKRYDDKTRRLSAAVGRIGQFKARE